MGGLLEAAPEGRYRRILRMKALTRKPVFWIAYALLSARRSRRHPAVSARDPARQSRHHDDRAEAIARPARRSRQVQARARRRAQRGALQPGRTRRRTTSSSKAAASAAFAALVAATSIRRTGGRCACSSPARSRKRSSGSGPTARRTDSRAAPGRPTCATRRPRRSRSRRARALAEARARADWGVDFARYTLLDQSQQTRPSGRVDQASCTSARETARRGAHPPAAHVAGDELIAVAPLCSVPEAFERRFQEMRSANNPIAGARAYRRRRAVRSRRLHLRLAVAVAPALARCGGRRSPPGSSSARCSRRRSSPPRPPRGSRFDTAQTRRRSGSGRSARSCRPSAAGSCCASCSWPPKALARRAFPRIRSCGGCGRARPAPTLAGRGRTLGGYLFVPIELALVALFYYATNHWLGWWQPSENADRSQHSRLGDAGAVADRGVAAGRLHGGVRVPRHPARARRADRRALRPSPLGIGDRVRAAGARVRRRRTRTIRAFRHIRAWSSCVVPSMLWAAIFLRFGLLPTIILHALFDLALMSIPLFLVDAPGARPAAGARHRRRAGAAWRRAVAARAGGRVARAARVAAQRRVAAGRRSAPTAARAAARRSTATAMRPRSSEPAAARHRRSRALVRVHAVSRRRAGAGARPRRAERSPTMRSRARRHARARVAAHAAIRLAQRRSGQWSGTGSSGARRAATRTARSSATRCAPPLWEVRYARSTATSPSAPRSGA